MTTSHLGHLPLNGHFQVYSVSSNVAMNVLADTSWGISVSVSLDIDLLVHWVFSFSSLKSDGQISKSLYQFTHPTARFNSSCFQTPPNTWYYHVKEKKLSQSNECQEYLF